MDDPCGASSQSFRAVHTFALKRRTSRAAGALVDVSVQKRSEEGQSGHVRGISRQIAGRITGPHRHSEDAFVFEALGGLELWGILPL